MSRKMPVDRQIDDYLRYAKEVRGLTQGTITGKRSVFKLFLENSNVKDLKTFTNKDYNEWVATMQESGIAASTLNMYSKHIVSLVKYYVDMGGRTPFKIALIKQLPEKPPRRECYTPEEIRRALSYANQREALMIKICFETGMRLAELSRLRLANFSGRQITFIGKGSKHREAYISEETLSELREYINDYEINDWLWTTTGDRPFAPFIVRCYLEKPFQAAGFTKFHPHTLRHSFATNLQVQGATLFEIQKMMGHANATTTERYLHGLNGTMQPLFDRYNVNL